MARRPVALMFLVLTINVFVAATHRDLWPFTTAAMFSKFLPLADLRAYRSGYLDGQGQIILFQRHPWVYKIKDMLRLNLALRRNDLFSVHQFLLEDCQAFSWRLDCDRIPLAEVVRIPALTPDVKMPITERVEYVWRRN